jgi:parvulin-like peptidyl-prolyl isomerase
MSYRNRPILDRKHRPRWQDEQRFQQLLVGGFALVIAVALGIFGATAWNNHYDSHLRQVAMVDGEPISRDAVRTREVILEAEIFATAADLQTQLGGPRDAIIEQQLSALQARLQDVPAQAAESLVNSTLQRAAAPQLGVAVSDAEVDALESQRRVRPERLRLSVIVREALPEEAEAGTEPTDEDFERAEREATALRQQIEAGTGFAALAVTDSQDPSAAAGGDIGLVQAEDPIYEEFFEAAEPAQEGEVVGPVRIDRGYALVELVERIPGGRSEELEDLLGRAGVSADDYRDYIRDEALDQAYRSYFEEEVAVSPQPQRRVAQIYLRPDAAQAAAGEQRRVRHVLVQPLPDEEDQAEASDEEWAAARQLANQVRDRLRQPDADWDREAAEYSGDPGSRERGGDLGWHNLPTAGFVEEFAVTAAALEVGEVSDPVRTQFGWHVIQVTGERESAAAQAAELVEQLRNAPESFAELARAESEDPASAQRGGVFGWVARYELDAAREEAIFGLQSVGSISEPVVVPNNGIYIYRLLATTASRDIDEVRLSEIRRTGYQRWLTDLRERSNIWIDPEFQTTT